MTPMTPSQRAEYAELRRKAEAATPGPWVNMPSEPFFGELRGCAEDKSFELIAVMPETDDRSNDFDFIAAANPQAVIGMLDRLDEAEKEVERLRKHAETYMKETTPDYDEGG